MQFGEGINSPRQDVAYMKAVVPGAPQRQATLRAFRKTCPPAQANTITTLIVE